DAHAFDLFLEQLGELFAAEESGTAEREIQEADDTARRQAARPALDRVELARQIETADEGTDRGAAYDVGFEACLDKRSERADMRPTAGDTASQCENNPWPSRHLCAS